MNTATEDRRPGLDAIMKRLRRENPRAPLERLTCMAKSIYSSKTIAVEKDGKMVEIPNPEYQGGRK